MILSAKTQARLRSAAAVLAGFLVSESLELLARLVLQRIPPTYPPTPLMQTLRAGDGLATALLGGYLTGRLALRLGLKSPMAHGLALALFLLVMDSVFPGGLASQTPGEQLFHAVVPAFAAIGGAYLGGEGWE